MILTGVSQSWHAQHFGLDHCLPWGPACVHQHPRPPGDANSNPLPNLWGRECLQTLLRVPWAQVRSPDLCNQRHSANVLSTCSSNQVRYSFHEHL